MAISQRYHVHVSDNGRLVLPKPLRQAIGVPRGGRLVAERRSGGEIVLLSFGTQLDTVRALLLPNRDTDQDD